MSDILVPPAQASGRIITEKRSAASAESVAAPNPGRVSVAGKFFRIGEKRWYLKGLTYGPFAPRAESHFLPPTDVLRTDLRRIRDLGANCIRVYQPPPRSLLDLALEQDLRVFVDVPWDKHRCFFEDWSSQEEARLRVRSVAEELKDHPALFAISVANEFPADIT